MLCYQRQMCDNYAWRGQKRFHKRDGILKTGKEICYLDKKRVVNFAVRKKTFGNDRDTWEIIAWSNNDS